MSVALTVPTSVEAGSVVVITGTGFTVNGSVKVRAYAEQDGSGGVEATAYLTADGSGNLTTVSHFEVMAEGPGHIDFTFNDVSAATTTDARVEVFQT
jgi:hypothetical protein